MSVRSACPLTQIPLGDGLTCAREIVPVVRKEPAGRRLFMKAEVQARALHPPAILSPVFLLHLRPPGHHTVLSWFVL